MTTTPSNTLLWFRRIGALALALSIGTFLVVRAQRQANPATPTPSPQDPAGAKQEAAPDAGPATASERLESPPDVAGDAALAAPAAATDNPAYLHGWKAGVFVEKSSGGVTPMPAVADEYLFSSKSLILGEPVKPEPKPGPEPTYLPSSKFKAPSGPILAPTPPPAPAKPSGQP